MVTTSDVFILNKEVQNYIIRREDILLMATKKIIMTEVITLRALCMGIPLLNNLTAGNFNMVQIHDTIHINAKMCYA